MWATLLKALFDSIIGALMKQLTGPKIDEVIHADAELESFDAKTEDDRSNDLIRRFDHVLP